MGLDMFIFFTSFLSFFNAAALIEWNIVTICGVFILEQEAVPSLAFTDMFVGPSLATW